MTVKKNFSLLVVLKLVIILLLSVAGVDLSTVGRSDVPTCSYASEQEHSSDVWVAGVSLGDKKESSTLPEEPFSKNEESEDENKTEEKSGEKLLTRFDSYSFSLSELTASNVSSYYRVFAYNKLTIPLYVLFHSWKSFLI